jgi:hypothetical protein
VLKHIPAAEPDGVRLQGRSNGSGFQA